jgi:HK97 family phage portal protein
LSLRQSLARLAFSFARAVRGRVRLPDADPWAIGRPWYLPPEALEFPHAYRLLPGIHFCVSIIQDAVASLPLRFYTVRGDEYEEIERTPAGRRPALGAPLGIADLWAAANSEDTAYELVEKLVGDLLIHGNAYLFKDYLGTKTIQQLWMIPPNSVSPVAGRGRTVSHYLIRSGASDVEVPREQIVQFRMYDPDHGIVGLSPLKALQRRYSTEHNAGRFMEAFYARGGMVAGHYRTEFAIEPDERNRLQREIESRFEGPENAWRMVLLPRNLEYVRAGLNMQEMAFIENHRLTLEDMLRVYKLPPMMAGMVQGSGLNSDVASVARSLMHEHAVLPILRRVSSTMNERLLGTGEFGPGVECEFDDSQAAAVQESRLARAKSYAEIAGGPVMTRAEIRDEMELEELDDPATRELLVPINMTTESQLALDNELAEAAAAAQPVPLSGDDQPDKESGDGTAAALTRGRDRRESLRVRASRLQTLHARRMARGFRRLFAEQERRVLVRLREQGGRDRRVVNVNDLLLDIEADRRLVRRLIRAVVADAGAEALAELGLDLLFDVSARPVAGWVETKAAGAVTHVNETTRAALRETLAEGLGRNESLAQLVARVRDVFGGRRANAVTIARTETTPAYNFGAVAAWDQSEVVDSKEWLTAGDEVVRDAHADAEGQIVPLDQPFTVGGEALDFPGDPSGSAENVINCRCTVLPVVGRSRRVGRPRRGFAERHGEHTNGNGAHALTVEEFLSAR